MITVLPGAATTLLFFWYPGRNILLKTSFNHREGAPLVYTHYGTYGDILFLLTLEQ